MQWRFVPAALAFLLAAVPAWAASAAGVREYKSVGNAPAVMYDAPTERGRKVFVAPRGMPVEVILTYGDWTKVRDADGDLPWVESKMLTAKRSVVVKAANAKVYAAPADTSAPVFTADRNVLLEWVESGPAGWVKVKHRDGQGGYVRAADVWGD